MNRLGALTFAAAVVLAAGAQAQSWSGRTPYQELETTPRWQNPYSKGDRSEYREPREYEGSGRIGAKRPPRADVTGSPREPLGGGSWMDRVR